MKIIFDYPPNYDRICKYFPVKNKKGIVFTYGNLLYNPDDGYIPEHLVVHEETHARQQEEHNGGAVGWWEQYFKNAKFRLLQELKAYQNQYQYAVKHENRKMRRVILDRISKDFASDIYGNLLTKKNARKLITGDAKIK